MSVMSAENVQTGSRAARSQDLIARYGLLALLAIAIFWFAQILPNFGTSANVSVILQNIAISALMFLGLTWVVASGSIDVSFMDVAALTTTLCAVTIVSGGGWGLAILVGLSVGLAVGLLNGVAIGIGGMPPLITTIAVGGLIRSIAWMLGGGGSIPLTARPGIVHEFLDLKFGPVPALFIAVAVVYAIAWYFQDKLTFGRYIYALQDNERAVVEAGLPDKALRVSTFVFSALCGSLAGILLTAYVNSGQPGLGASYFLDGLTAVFLGAVVIKIGKPNVIGTLAAVTLLIVLVNAGAMLGWPNYVREIIKGSILFLSVALVFYVNRRN